MKQEGERGCGEKERAAQFSAVQRSAVQRSQCGLGMQDREKERAFDVQVDHGKAHFRIAARNALVLFSSSALLMGLVLGLARPTS